MPEEKYSLKDPTIEKLTRVEVMKRATFIKVKNKMILKCDLSFLDSAENVGRVTDYFCSMVEKVPKNPYSVWLTLLVLK